MRLKKNCGNNTDIGVKKKICSLILVKKTFKVSENFYINQSGGLTFDFQLYELAPYAAGPVSLELYDIDQLIKSDFLPPMPTLKTEM